MPAGQAVGVVTWHMRWHGVPLSRDWGLQLTVQMPPPSLPFPPLLLLLLLLAPRSPKSPIPLTISQGHLHHHPQTPTLAFSSVSYWNGFTPHVWPGIQLHIHMPLLPWKSMWRDGDLRMLCGSIRMCAWWTTAVNWIE